VYAAMRRAAFYLPIGGLMLISQFGYAGQLTGAATGVAMDKPSACANASNLASMEASASANGLGNKKIKSIETHLGSCMCEKGESFASWTCSVTWSLEVSYQD
jgi:hypothetical protein